MIQSSDSLSDLRRREADIAIRHVRPGEDGLIAKRVCDSIGGFYASADWIARHPHVRSRADLGPQDLVAFDDTGTFTRYMREFGVDVSEDGLRLMSASSVVIWQMVQQGLGVGLMLDEIARRTPGVVRLFPDFETPRFPIWLVTHRELRTSRRIRLVYDILSEDLPRAVRAP